MIFVKLVLFLSNRIAGVQNKTGANSLLSPPPPLNRSGLKLVCIVNTPNPHPSHAHLLQTTDHKPKTIDYKLQTTDYRLQMTD
jgi:hypothetical protein